MIVLSNNAEQTVAVGDSIVFNTTILHTGTGECHRPNTSSIKMRGNGVYEISFSGNIGSTTAATAVQLNIETGGEVLPETTMIATSTAAGDSNNVATTTLVKNCCCDYDRITVTNTGTGAVTISANPVLTVRRLS